MHQQNEKTLDLTLDASFAEQQLTPQVDKAVAVIGLVEKERKLFKNQAKDYRRRIQELESQLSEAERDARDTQMKLKKKISDITESRDAIREQLASTLLIQESLERDKGELRTALMKLQSTTTSLWRNIPDLLIRTAKRADEENEEDCEMESSIKEADVSMDVPTPEKKASLNESLAYFSPEGR
ncbi:moesin isoform X2 [Fopius arisanus]|nr:PREDICTED: moesin-like isoform X2 [Fopius arisanus]